MNFLRCLGCTPRTVNLSLRIPSAKYATHPFKFMEVEDRWKEKDGIPRSYNLIYKAPMDNMLNYLSTYITVSTSVVAGAGVYYGFTVDRTELNNPILVGDDVILANSSTEGLVFLLAFIGFNIALKILLSRFVIRLYQDGENYTAVFRGHILNSVTKHEFQMNNFKRLDPPLVVSWGDARFSLGDKHAIILEKYFKTPEHFNCLLYKKKPIADSVED